MTKLRAIGTAVVACASVAVTHVTAADAISDATAAVIQKWANAVEVHVAGHPDEAVATVCRMSYRDRVDMNAGLDLFLTALQGAEYRSKDNNRAVQAVIAAAHRAGQPTPARFLKRAAILHADAAIYRALFPRPAETTAPTIYDSMGSGVRVPPLLNNKRFATDKDGEFVGSGIADWNWPFARDLVDRLVSRPEQGSDPFLGAWYHAIAAWMLANGFYGDAEDHLHHAAEILPNDARVMFDRASYAEILGFPKSQVLPASSPSGGLVAVHIPRATDTNAEAERLFRRAFQLDPTFVEARVRLARLLDVRGAHAEALLELRSALETNPPRIVAFYAHLFAARAGLNAGSLPDAANHYRDALSLYPNAQSALLGVSQTALLAADVTGALAPIERLGPNPVPPDADPWWQYDLAAGRDATKLMQSLWAATPPGAVQTARLH
ncbi:MAG TPA: tetratricopeptide repeat protein [Vicinamibacterales bacterium]